MNKTKKIYSTFLLFFLIVLFACNSDIPKNEKMSQGELVKRGKYLVVTNGCGDCHTPKIMGDKGPVEDGEKLLSGYPADEPLAEVDKSQLSSWVLSNPGATGWVGPWGVSFAANITSDDSGIGTWSLDQFKNAMRKGKFKGLEGSRDLLPPMPWPSFRHFTDEDIEAIFTYLKSTKPIRNIVPQPIAYDDL